MRKLRRYRRNLDRRGCALYFLRGCAGTSDRRERKATPSGVFDWTLCGQSGAWGNPNERIGISEKDIPIHCSPFPSQPPLSLLPQAFEDGKALRVYLRF